MTDHATEAAQDQHSVDLSTIASLRAQLAAANDSIARVRALCDEAVARHYGVRYGAPAVGVETIRAALTPEAPR